MEYDSSLESFSFENFSSDNFTGNSTDTNHHTNVLSVFVLVLFVVIGCFGNAIVIFIIVKHRDMRTVTNYFVLSLAVTDIALLIICAIPTCAVYAINTLDWPLGDFMCRLTGYIMNVSLSVYLFYFNECLTRYIMNES